MFCYLHNAIQLLFALFVLKKNQSQLLCTMSPRRAERCIPDRPLSNHCLSIPPRTPRVSRSNHPPAIHSAPSPVLRSVSVLPHSTGLWAVGTEPWLGRIAWGGNGATPLVGALWMASHLFWVFPSWLGFSSHLVCSFFIIGFLFFVFFFDHFFLSPANFYSNMEGWGLSIGKAGEASRRSKSSGPSSPPSFPNQPCRAKAFQGQIQAAKEEEKCLPCQPVHHSGKRPLVPSPQNCYVRMKSGSCSFPCVILVQCPNAKIPSNGALSTPGFGPSGRVLGSITLHCSPLPWAALDTVYAPFGKGFQPSHSHPKGAFPAIKL